MRTIQIENLKCGGCANTIKKGLLKLDGITDVEINIDTSDDTGDAGFWDVGNDYTIVLSPDETVDGQTVVQVLGVFSIENRSMSTASGEPGQGIPPASATMAEKIDYLYKNWRNKKRQNSTLFELYDDAGTTVDQKATISEASGLFTKTEMESGA